MIEKKNLPPQIQIRPLTLNDYDAALRWSKDDSFCSANGWESNRSPEELHRWWLLCVDNAAEDFIRMGIEFKGKLIGYADLADIKNSTAEMGIAIGESELWGRGLGSHAACSMLEYGAEKLGIKAFTAETNEANIRSQKMLEKIGFKEISRLGSEEYLGVAGLLIQYKLELG